MGRQQVKMSAIWRAYPYLLAPCLFHVYFVYNSNYLLSLNCGHLNVWIILPKFWLFVFSICYIFFGLIFPSSFFRNSSTISDAGGLGIFAHIPVGGEMRQPMWWDARCVLGAQVQAGKQGNTWQTGAHTPPTAVHLGKSGWEEQRRRWKRRRFMQIDGGAGVDVAADVGVQAAPASRQDPPECTHIHPDPKCHLVAQM